MLKQVTDHFPMDYGGCILLPVSIFQLRGLVPAEQLVLLLNTEAKKALNTAAFPSSFVIFCHYVLSAIQKDDGDSP